MGKAPKVKEMIILWPGEASEGDTSGEKRKEGKRIKKRKKRGSRQGEKNSMNFPFARCGVWSFSPLFSCYSTTVSAYSLRLQLRFYSCSRPIISANRRVVSLLFSPRFVALLGPVLPQFEIGFCSLFGDSKPTVWGQFSRCSVPK